MKTLLVSILFLVLFTSCSTAHYKYGVNLTEHKVTAHVEMNENGKIHITEYLTVPDLENNFRKHWESGQINRNPKYSCFKGEDAKKSVNYIRVIDSDVELYRPFVTETQSQISYKQSTIKDSIGFRRFQRSDRTGNLKVRTLECFIKIDPNDSGRSWVYSEIYE